MIPIRPAARTTARYIALSSLVAAVPSPTYYVPAAPPVTRVVMLGTGTPNVDPDRSGPAVAIVVDSSTYIVDAGPGIVRRAAAAKIAMPSLRVAFLTHLHSDHTLGLPDLMFSPWVLGRTVPLDVYGPPGTTAMVDHLQAAYAEDIEIRLHGGEPSNKLAENGTFDCTETMHCRLIIQELGDVVLEGVEETLDVPTPSPSGRGLG